MFRRQTNLDHNLQLKEFLSKSIVSSTSKEYMMENDEVTESSLKDLFQNKDVFITGATGFLGKVLLQRLLEVFPGINKIIILVRDKEGQPSSLETLYKSSVFDKLRLQSPEIWNKVTAINGDISERNCGLSTSDIEKLRSVSFVFHCAANVRFEEEPRNTLKCNLMGVNNIIEVCKNLEELQALVHVSTAYSFCNQSIIAEEIYNEDIKPANILHALCWMGDAALKELTQRAAANRPSLYQYSKALGEILVEEEKENLPVIIVRPAIVTAAYKDPFPGWIDNINGPSGFFALSGKGILKTLLIKPEVNVDWVPVDIVANTLIIAAHFIATRRQFYDSEGNARGPSKLYNANSVPIINCVCPSTNRLNWLDLVNICMPLLHKYPSMYAFRPPGGAVTFSGIMHFVYRFFYHYLPAFTIDCVRILFLKKAKYVNLYSKMHRVLSYLQIYTTHKFLFKNENMLHLVELYRCCNKVLPINQDNVKWMDYLDDKVHGVRRFYSKEPDYTLTNARIRLLKLKLIWTAAGVLPILVAILYTKRRLSTIMNLSTFMKLSIQHLENIIQTLHYTLF